MSTRELFIATAADMEALGTRLVARVGPARLIYVRGPLGAGKTTLVRGMLRGLGHAGAVKSPTFTLVEPYTFAGRAFYHFDLYRVQHPEELEFIGLRDYLDGEGVCVVEWAERAQTLLPPPDLEVMIGAADTGRSVRFTAHTEQGKAVLSGL